MRQFVESRKGVLEEYILLKTRYTNSIYEKDRHSLEQNSCAEKCIVQVCSLCPSLKRSIKIV